MKLVVGLGNPGKKYEKTRHNIGFMVIDYYAQKYDLEFKSKMNGLYAEKIINDEKYIFLKPQSYMNLSGDIVRKYYDYFNINKEDILVIYDDVDFEVGSFRIKRGGSSAGHNGINDIINKLDSKDINRIRIGTSKKSDCPMYDYVTGKLSKSEYKTISDLFPTISDIINDFAINNIDDLMAKYNKKE